MSTYAIEEVLQKWKLEEMTTEQAVGHLLQNLQQVSDRVSLVERRVETLYRERRADSAKKKGVRPETEADDAVAC